MKLPQFPPQPRSADLHLSIPQARMTAILGATKGCEEEITVPVAPSSPREPPAAALTLRVTLGSCIPIASSPGRCQHPSQKGLFSGLAAPGQEGISWKLELKVSGGDFWWSRGRIGARGRAGSGRSTAQPLCVGWGGPSLIPPLHIPQKLLLLPSIIPAQPERKAMAGTASPLPWLPSPSPGDGTKHRRGKILQG